MLPSSSSSSLRGNHDIVPRCCSWSLCEGVCGVSRCRVQVREELSFSITQPILHPDRFEELGMQTAAVSLPLHPTCAQRQGWHVADWAALARLRACV